MDVFDNLQTRYYIFFGGAAFRGGVCKRGYCNFSQGVLHSHRKRIVPFLQSVYKICEQSNFNFYITRQKYPTFIKNTATKNTWNDF